MWTYELAESLHMTVQEMLTGKPGMSAHEFCVGWPTYFRFKQRARSRAEEKAKMQRGRLR